MRSSFPPELFKRLEKSLGDAQLAKDVADTSNEKPVNFLRCNVLVQDRDKTQKQLLSKELGTEVCRHSRVGLVVTEAGGKARLLGIPERKSGLFDMQVGNSSLSK